MQPDPLVIVDGLNASWHTDPVVLEHLIAGNVAAVNATVAANHDTLWTLKSIAALLLHIAGNPDKVLQVKNVADIRRASETGRVGYILGFQDTVPIGDDLRLLRVFHELGVRVIQLTYNFENLVGCGCQCGTDTGLTPFGRSVIKELNDLGVLIDLSHCGPKTSLEAVEVSRLPVAFTHANSTATKDHARNKSPEAIKTVAAAGGVIGAVAVPPLLTFTSPATIDHYVAAIEDLVQLVGPDHVAIGPDFMEAMPAEVAATVLQGLPDETKSAFAVMAPVKGFESPAAYPRLAEALSTRGFCDDDVRKVMGENWLRLYTEVWKDVDTTQNP